VKLLSAANTWSDYDHDASPSPLVGLVAGLST
jgi:hypothetical protein